MPRGEMHGEFVATLVLFFADRLAAV